MLFEAACLLARLQTVALYTIANPNPPQTRRKAGRVPATAAAAATAKATAP